MQRLLAERACERLILEFVHRLDLGEPGEVAELFTEDGSWEWPPPGDGRAVRGRAALREYFGGRPADRRARRLSPLGAFFPGGRGCRGCGGGIGLLTRGC